MLSTYRALLASFNFMILIMFVEKLEKFLLDARFSKNDSVP